MLVWLPLVNIPLVNIAHIVNIPLVNIYQTSKKTFASNAMPLVNIATADKLLLIVLVAASHN